MTKVMEDLVVAGAGRLPGWDPRDSSQKWLRSLKDMARSRQQWRM